MRAYRLSGDRPGVDTTAVSGPNLEFATALLEVARAGSVAEWEARALSTIDFFTKTRLGADGLVPHAWDGRTASGPTWLRNQVAGIEACVAAYRATNDAQYLERAKVLFQSTRTAFRSDVSGSYWDTPLTASGAGRLTVRMRPLGPNVRLAQTLLDLFTITGEAPYRGEAETILTAFSVSFGSAGFDALSYAMAVHRLIWQLRGGPVVMS
jgi:uncharacterized protein YyaL (SSP411 family)